jgi:hypothetical protein
MWIEEIVEYIPIIPGTLSVTESLYEFKLECSLSLLEPYKSQQFTPFLGMVNNRDDFILEIIINDDVIIPINSKLEIENFIQELNDKVKLLDDGQVPLSLKIHKKIVDHAISVYNLEIFEHYLSEMIFEDLLNSLSKLIGDSRGIKFEYFDQYNTFGSTNIIFGSPQTQVSFENQDFVLNEIRDFCHFENITVYPFTPSFFYLQNRIEKFSEINSIFDKLFLIFCISAIFDITSILNNSITYKLIGYKVISGKTEFTNLSEYIQSNQTYYEIYSWIYSEKSKVLDKLGIARNILSISLAPNKLEIDQKSITSMYSGYQIYQKENISRYIDIRNKISDQLVNVTAQSSKAISNFVDNFKKSIFAFLSFFLSTLILRVFSTQSFENLFPKDSTILFMVFLFLSTVFLLFSNFEISADLKQIAIDYENIKCRYKDLLDDQDIRRILNNDSDFNASRKYFTKKQVIYNTLWVIMLVVFLAAILSMSTFINWSTIADNMKFLSFPQIIVDNQKFLFFIFIK